MKMRLKVTSSADQASDVEPGHGDHAREHEREAGEVDERFLLGEREAEGARLRVVRIRAGLRGAKLDPGWALSVRRVPARPHVSVEPGAVPGYQPVLCTPKVAPHVEVRLRSVLDVAAVDRLDVIAWLESLLRRGAVAHGPFDAGNRGRRIRSDLRDLRKRERALPRDHE